MPRVPHMMLGLLHASTRSAGCGAVVEHGRTTVRAAALPPPGFFPTDQDGGEWTRRTHGCHNRI